MTEAEIEAELQNRLWERTQPFIRHMLLAAAALFLVFSIWDNHVDPAGGAATIVERLVGSACFGLMYLLVAFTAWGRRHAGIIYMVAVPVACVLILWLLLQVEGAYLLGHSSFLAVAMVVIVIGPTLRASIPLALCTLVIPDGAVLSLSRAGVELPGLPDFATAVSIALNDLGVAVIVVVVLLVQDRLQTRALSDNMHFEQLAGTDPLTAVQNRRQLQAEFARERARQRRHGRPIGVLSLDIDHFKQVNDRHGHGVGDEVLRYLTRRWDSLLREVDGLARIGGEEFVVLMPETGVEGAMEAAQRLRTATAAEPVSTAVGNLDITVSIGVAVALPEDDDLEAVLQRADRALYRAKSGGRNRCEPDRPDAEPAAQAAPAG